MIDLVHTVGTRVPRLLAWYYPDLLWRVSTTERVVYFTFDDGPTPTMTAPLLDVLARFEADATFFLLGEQVEQDPGLVRAIHDAGHTLGNHTYTHPNTWRTSDAEVLDELERTTDLLEELVEAPVRWMRPPYGRFTRAMRDWCQERDQRCTMWDVGPGDFLASATQEKVEARILQAVRPGSIIVLHDNPKAQDVTPPALATVLAQLRDDGWRFEAL